jgi:hypothetical protein
MRPDLVRFRIPTTDQFSNAVDSHQRTKPFTPRHNGKVCEDLAPALHRAGLTPAKV